MCAFPFVPSFLTRRLKRVGFIYLYFFVLFTPVRTKKKVHSYNTKWLSCSFLCCGYYNTVIETITVSSNVIITNAKSGEFNATGKDKRRVDDEVRYACKIWRSYYFIIFILFAVWHKRKYYTSCQH